MWGLEESDRSLAFRRRSWRCSTVWKTRSISQGFSTHWELQCATKTGFSQKLTRSLEIDFPKFWIWRSLTINGCKLVCQSKMVVWVFDRLLLWHCLHFSLQLRAPTNSNFASLRRRPSPKISLVIQHWKAGWMRHMPLNQRVQLPTGKRTGTTLASN